MKSGSMGGATVPAPRGPGSDVRRLGVFAVIAVLMTLSVAVVPLVTSGPASSQTAAPSDDYAGQDITYHYGSGDPRQVTVHYDGIAATEYNPEYWEGTFASTSGTGTGNWIGPEITYKNLTFQRTVSWDIGTWNLGGGGTLTLALSSDVTIDQYTGDTDYYDSSSKSVDVGWEPGGNHGSITFTFKVDSVNATKVFAGWSTTDDESLDYYPGDVVPSTVTDLYAVWVEPNIFVNGAENQNISGDSTWNPTFTTYKSVSSISQINSSTLLSDCIYNPDDREADREADREGMFVNIFSVTSSGGSTTGGYRIDIPCTIRSHNQANLSFGTISLEGDTVIDNVSLTSSAPNNSHGDGSDRGIFANGHRLILGTGIGTGAASFNSAPQVFGGGTRPVETAVRIGKSIVSADAELSGPVDLGTFVIVHSGTYYNIVGGGADSDIGLKDKPLSTYVVLKGGMSLDTVVGGSGAGGSVYGSAVPTWKNGPDQGGTYIYSTGFRMPGDSYHESKVGTDYIPDGMWLEESTIMEGGVSGRDSNNYSDPTYVYGSTHIFLSGDTDIWDVQAGSRRAFSHVEFAYLEISGNAVVRHVACGTITDGNRQSSSQSSPMPVTSVDATKIVVTGNAWVASVFGAGYDTWYLPEATTMAEGKRIDVQIKGGTVGSVYGGGYRGTITVGDPDDTRVDDGVFVEISGGTVLGDVYGGGRGGLDKVTHSSGGGINSEGYMDSTGHSVVIGDVFVTVSGGTVVGSVYGGGESVPKLSSYSGVNATFSASDPDVAAVYGDTYVKVSGGTVKGNVYGGGKGVLMHNGQPYDAPMEVPAIVGKTGSYSCQDILWKSGGGAVYDSSVDYTGYARVTGSTMVAVKGGTVNGNIYGGAEIGRVNATANVQVLGYSVSIQGSVYGGGEGHEQYSNLGAVSNTSVRVADADVKGNVYGGGAYGMVVSVDGTMGAADVSVESSTVRGDVYGGGQGLENRGRFGGVGVTILDISDSTVNGSVYGGGQYGAVDTTGVTVTRSIVNGSIYGGGLGTADRVSVYSDITLTVDSTTVAGNIYGGSAYGLVEGNIVTELRGGTAASTVYGGGLGTSNRTSTSGSRTVRLENVSITGSLYGGSQNGNDDAASLDGNTFVYILSAEIGGSVFGGGYRGTTWGDTYVYIGCTDSETPHEGTVTIGQSVYGGGDVGDVSAGDALFDTTLVYGNSELIVDGSSCTINFNGSLFGEGNSCLTEGNTTIHITDVSLNMMSVQRADTVRITSSEIHLEGRNSGTSSSASEKFSFYSVGRLDLVGGSQIYLSSPLGETGNFYSLATPSVFTTETAPLNTIYVEEGTIFSLQNSEGFGRVYGYTILSLLASETYYGAFAYGSVDSVGGFVTDDGGLYRTLQYSDLSSPECRYWYISGVVSQTGSAVLKYDPSLGEDAVVSVELPPLDIPMTSSSTSLLYGGGYFTSATADAYRLVSGDPTERGTLSVLMGYAGEGLTTFDNGRGMYVPDRSSETTSAVLEDAGGPDSPRISIRVSGINPMLSGYAGTVTIQFQEVVVADSPAGESNYVYFNTIDVSIAIYIEGHDHPHEGTSTIDIIAGSGQSSIVIPAVGFEGYLYVTDARFNGGSLEGAPALTISGVNNHEGSMGWTGRGFEHVLATGSDSAYLGRFTGMFPSTIQFSIEGFEGTDCSFAVDFEVRDGSGTMYLFTITVKVVTHGPVTVTFVDSRQNVSIPMQFDYGTTITASDGPQVMGNFIGWYNDETFTSQFNFNLPLIRDITLYARYMYTVTFDEMYDGRTSTYYVPMGEPFTIDNYGEKDPVRPGYSFTGWYKDRDCLVLWDFKNDKVEGDITLYAGWEPRDVILDFYDEGGKVILTLGAGDGEMIRLDDLFGPYLEQASDEFGTVPEGGTLVWYVSVSGSSIPVYADNAIEQRMVTVENGGWHVKVHADVLYYSITVVQDAQDYGSTVVPPKEFSVGREGGYYTFTPTGADRVGYELSGWIIEKTDQEYAPGVTIKILASEVSKYLSEDGKLHLVAQWRALTYEVVVMKPAGGSVTATLISSDGSTSSGREYTSYISFSAHYGDRLFLSYVSEGGYTFEGWVVSKAGAIDDASKQSTYMTVRGNSRVEVRVGGLESAVIRLSVDGAAPGGSITLTGDGRTYTVRQSSVDGEYGVFSVSALLGEYALSYGGSGFGNITVVSGGVSGSYRLVSLALAVTPGADVGTLPSYAVPGTQLALDIPHGFSVSKLTLRYDGADHDMGAVSAFTVPSAQDGGVTVKVELETSSYTIEFVVDFTGSDGAKVVFDKVASITVEYSPDGTVYPELPWVQLNGLDLNALDRETTSPYSFLGWYLDKGFMQRVQAGDAFPEEDVVLHASIAYRQAIIYVVNVYMMGIGGDYPDTPTHVIPTTELENQYVGWRPDYPGFAVDAKSSGYEKTVVEAGMDDLNIFMVRASGIAVLDPVGGTVSESGGWTLNEEGKLTREVWYGETVTLPVPVKTENVFGGWSVDGSTVTQVTVGDSMLDEADNTVSFMGEAQWTVNEYRLVLSTLYGTFSNGQTTMTVSVPYGTSLSDDLDGYRAELEKEAGMYAYFGGWSPVPPETMPADTLTLTAQWTPKEVSITVKHDEHVTISVSGSSLTGSDGSYVSVFNGSIDLMLSFDSGYSLKKATGANEQPVRKSAVQFEWTVPLNGGNVTVDAGSSVDDVTLSLVLEVTSVESAVTVTYVINGTPAASLFQNVPSGENVVLHDLSELQGLTFDGWYSDPEMKNKIEGNTIFFVDADDREVVYGSLTADTPTVHITAGDLVLDKGVYVGTYNGGRHTLTAVPDTYAEGPTALDYDLTYRIIWGDKENRTISFINADEYSVTLTVTATLVIGGTVSDVSEPHEEEFKIRIDKADAEVVWVHDKSYIYNGTDRSGTVYAYYEWMDGRDHQLTVSSPESFMDVGDYTFTVPGEDSNHIFSNTTLHLSIGKKVLTIAQSGSLSYSGQAQSPKFTDDRVTGDDIFYDITDSKTDAGTYTVSLAEVQLTGADAGNYELPASVTWTIDRVAAEDLTWKVEGTYTYTGSEVIPEVQAYIGGEKVDMVLDTDYSVAGMQGRNNTDAGTAYVLVECTGNYSGRAEVVFEIGQLDLSKVIIEITGDTIYTGDQIIPGYTVTAVDGTPLRLTAEDVRITFGDNINAGTDAGSITISALEGSSGNCVNSVTKAFTISKAELSVDITGDLSVVFGETGSLGLTGYDSAYGGTIAWTSSDTEVATISGDGTEIEVVPVSAGSTTIKVSVTGMKNYQDAAAEIEFTVNNAVISGIEIKGYDGTYDGQAHDAIVNITGTLPGDKISYLVDGVYTEAEPQVTDVADSGTFYVKVQRGGYHDFETTVQVSVSPADIDDVYISQIGDQTYAGSEIRPGVSVSFNDVSLIQEKDYTLSYSGELVSVTEDGAIVTITGIGNYDGTRTVMFSIVPKEVTIVWGSDVIFTYNGSNQAPEYEVSSGIDGVGVGIVGFTVTKDDSQTESYADVGSYVLTITSVGNNNLTVPEGSSKEFRIVQKTVGVSLSEESFTYNGQEHEVNIVDKGIIDAGVEVSAVGTTSATDAGTYTVTLSLTGDVKGNYKLSAIELKWTIVALSLDGVTIVIEDGDFVYTGGAITPDVTVTATVDGVSVTIPASDYHVGYENNTVAGEATITVTPEGDNCTGSATATFKILQKEVTIDWGDGTSLTFNGEDRHPGFAIDSGIEGITVKAYFEVRQNGSVAESYADVGSYTLVITGLNNDNFKLPTDTDLDFEIVPLEISAKQEESFVYNGNEREVSFVLSGYIDGRVPGYEIVGGDKGTNAGTYTATVKLTGPDAGNYYLPDTTVQSGRVMMMSASSGADAVYEVEWVISQLSIDGAEVILGQYEYIYSGSENQPGVVSVVIDGITLGASDYSIDYQGNIDAGTARVIITAQSSNFTGEATEVFTIHKKTTDVSLVQSQLIYNGEEQKVEVADITADLVSSDVGKVFVVFVSGNAGTNAGEYTATVKLDGERSHNYVLSTSEMKWEIQKRHVALTSGSGEKTYDGQPLTVGSFIVGGYRFVNGHGAELTYTGTQTDAGSSKNTFTYVLTGGATSDNYEIEVSYGTLTVNKKSIADGIVNLADGAWTYDGTEKEPDVISVMIDGLIMGTGFDVVYEGNIHAGTATVKVTAGEGGNFTGTAVGTFLIGKASVTFESGSGEKVYDGTPLTVTDTPKVTAGKLFGDDEFRFAVTGTLTGVGSVDNSFTVTTVGDTREDDYEITCEFGTLTVSERTLSQDDFMFIPGEDKYTGSAITGTLSPSGWTPAEGDCQVSYSDNTNAGTAKVIITADGDNCTGSVEYTWTISKKVLEPVLSEGSFVYDGEEHTAELGDLSASIAQGDDLNVYLKGTVSATDAGTYHVEVAMEGSDAGNYSLNATAFTWIIEKADLGSAHVTVPDGLIHTGSAVEPDVLVELGGMTLVAGRDYTLSYADNYDAGTASVTVTAVEDGNFEGSLTDEFDIGRAHLALVDIADLDDAVYHGSAHTPEISAEYNGSELIEGMHYTVEYHDNIEAGTATAILRAVDGSNFTGYRHLTFNISPVPVDGFGIGDVDDRVYTGSPIEPGISAVFNGAPLTEWEDYVLSYADNTDAGTAVIIIEGRGNFSGVREIGFTIAPASMEDVSIVPVPDQMYTGAEVRPGITATLNGLSLVEGEDYILSYVGDTVNVTGDCVYVVAEGIGNLTGTVSIPYRIVYDGLQDITGITVNGYTGVYDGMEHIAVTVTGTMQGDKVSYSTDGTTFVSDVPTVTHVSDSGVVWVKVERPGCVPTMFGVSVTVAPAGLTVESSSVQGMYDGEPLTGHEVTVVNGQLFGDDGFIWVFTGQQTAPGSSANTFVPAALPGTEAGDYIITLVYGTLTVDQSAISESSSWVLALIMAIGIAAASYHGIMWVSGGRPLEALSALASRLASAIRRV